MAIWWQSIMHEKTNGDTVILVLETNLKTIIIYNMSKTLWLEYSTYPMNKQKFNLSITQNKWVNWEVLGWYTTNTVTSWDLEVPLQDNDRPTPPPPHLPVASLCPLKILQISNESSQSVALEFNQVWVIQSIHTEQSFLFNLDLGWMKRHFCGSQLFLLNTASLWNGIALLTSAIEMISVWMSVL